ncbi:hypothetical protein [Shinella sedimenti]|jgi:hypothetical protein|uniref:Uncharacterized protein n=1 Tax=Shinella sedimenti TaxID=2919913 RepID=A0ABT0CJ62_9HYPH|nr:hypothetical protein [Shinella sedimenti]MCJ8148657.1 hypothetical protein [Shinella sedimenti]
MSTITIEKYVDGIRVEELKLPTAPLRFVAGLLPARARRELLQHGLDIDALLYGATPSPEPQWMDVEEKNVAKRIRISRQD